MRHTPQKQAGFTLIEAVVAASVFAFVVASSLGVYLATVRLDAKSRAERTLQQNALFIMDYISKEIRNGSIDYGSTNNATTLSLVNQENINESFAYNSGAQSVTLTKSGLGSTTLNSSDVRVANMSFSLSPTTDPFNLANDVHVQPHVTVVLNLVSANAKPSEASTMSVQSTFTVRDYPSRQP